MSPSTGKGAAEITEARIQLQPHEEAVFHPGSRDSASLFRIPGWRNAVLAHVLQWRSGGATAEPTIATGPRRRPRSPCRRDATWANPSDARPGLQLYRRSRHARRRNCVAQGSRRCARSQLRQSDQGDRTVQRSRLRAPRIQDGGAQLSPRRDSGHCTRKFACAVPGSAARRHNGHPRLHAPVLTRLCV